MKTKVRSYVTFLICLLFLVSFTGCQLVSLNKNAANDGVNIKNNTLAVTFASDGTLWRLLPSRDFVYVDYSKDKGLTYSQPVKVNQKTQKISAWPENPPAIAVTKSSRILVLYYADEQQKSTSYFSYSDDLGRSFSQPVLISDHATTDMHYMDKMLLDKKDKVHFFWHDKRDEKKDSKLGTGVLSLYHAQSENLAGGVFKSSLVSHSVCSCCRTAVSLSPQGQPVILMRMVFADGTRDHALLTKNSVSEWSLPKHISDDQWEIEACPEHGPALAVDAQGRSHLTWFSLGNKRQGIFYAYTDDYGKNVSEPMSMGELKHLSSHPDVIATGNRVVLAWTEFNGTETSLHVQESTDRGVTWQEAKKVATSSSSVGHPKILAHDGTIFISWLTKKEGHRLIEIK